MSGGVDSSVTAALLKAEGYDVVGVTLQLYDHGAATHRKGACCAGQDIHDARAVADRIGIPHYVLDYESRFKEAVIDRFAESYVAGETPVPCVDCNMSIKFKDLLGTARELGAKVLATGHYVASRRLPDGSRALYRAKEEERDQSYFLFGTTHAQLDLLRFPLGDLGKAQTRELARQFGLAVADKHDSQDICFVPTGRYTDVIERLKPGAAAAGDVVDMDGKVLGRHDGIIHFTIGQRRGLKIAGPAPLYVVALDADRQRVVVGPREALTMRRIALRDVNWIGEGALDRVLDAGRLEVFVKVRSTRPPRAAFLSATAGGFEIELVDGEDGVSPGQACVFYDSAQGQARVLGGGFIRAAARATRMIPKGTGFRIDHAQDTGTAWGRRSTETRSRRRTRAGRRSMTSCSARCSSAAGRRRSRRPKSISVRQGGRILEVGVGTGLSLQSYNRKNRLVGIDISAPMLRRAQGPRHRAGPRQRRGAGGDGRQASRRAGRFVRCGGGAVCHHRGAGSGSDARRVRPRAQARRRDHPGQSPRRREWLSLGVRAGLLADRAAARLEPGVSLGPPGALGRARRRSPDRAPADAADGAFLADPVRQGSLNAAAMEPVRPAGR